MASRILYTAVAVAGIAAASGAAWWYQNRPASPGTSAAAARPDAARPAGAAPGSGGGPVAVEAARVSVARLADDAQAVGSLRSRRSVMVRPEVSGRVTQINFRDGERVRRGQLLVQFDDQLPQAQVQQAQAELSIAQANDKRNRELVAQGFISQRSVDESAANLQVAQAKLALARATAERLRIMAPFDGVAGIRNVNVGDYLKDGTDIVNVEDLDAVYVDFRLPERFQNKIQRGQRAVLEMDALPGRRFVAVVQAIDPLIDANGRSVAVRGCVDNRELALRPGMFARVNTVFSEREQALVVPEEALVPQGARQFVYRVVQGEEGTPPTARRVEVRLGVRQPGRVEVLDGLAAGDQVVTAGQQRLQRDGAAVRVVNVAASGAAPAGAAAPVARTAPPAAAPAAAPAAVRPGNPCQIDVAGGARGTPAASPAAAPATRAAPRNPA
ncbi:MAG: efflux RND transporter periplasmic adaptor subunit [Burkholderiaceae bacterium]|nr:efflux RND transporter periplasmic adaptor subunit [Burkholderiaceae bacterium]